MDNREPKLVYRPRLDNLEIPAEMPQELSVIDLRQIPWDCLNDLRKNVVYAYLYEQLDFQQIAHKYQLNNKARAKMEFYYALTTLSEFGTMRAFIDGEHWDDLTYKQQDILCAYYKNNISLKELAESLEISKQAVQQMISRIITKFDIKWQVFVYKEGSRVIYNVPELMK